MTTRGKSSMRARPREACATIGAPGTAPVRLTPPDTMDSAMAPERALVGFGFRCWMRGAAHGEIASWELCWNAFAQALGTTGARRAVGDLSCWVRSLRASAGRTLKVFPTHCPGLCRDEVLAVSMIAASQNDVCPAMRACAYALLESPSLDAPVELGQTFATTLRREGVVLATSDLVNAAALVGTNTVDTHAPGSRPN
ncbi:MAG: hypothetical protein AAGJ70_01145 [Pseudomonadota bacterium]